MKICRDGEEALSSVKSDHRIFVHGSSATPLKLIEGLVKHSSRLKNVELIHIHTCGPALYGDPKFKNSFKVANLFLGENLRGRLNYETIDYIPCFLSEMPQLFRSGKRPIDIALVQVSPPDEDGLVSLGTAVDIAKSAVDSAKIVIAQINKRMPKTHGHGLFPVSEIDFAIEVDEPIPENLPLKMDSITEKIGKNTASLIEDGSTLQMGIGGIPDAVLRFLQNHKNLGMHTEMWSDGALDLIKRGVINNKEKKIHKGVSVSTFLMGTKALFDFVDDNPEVMQLEASFVNNPAVICQNPKVAAINSAIEIDLTGQVCADSIGSRIYSGVGGQMDFIRGASLSEGGKPIIALPSRTHKGQSRIVCQLKKGAGVVTTRAHTHYVVTEYGMADLYGKTLSERAKSLIAIAHPEDRENLEAQWHEAFRSE